MHFHNKGPKLILRRIEHGLNEIIKKILTLHTRFFGNIYSEKIQNLPSYLYLFNKKVHLSCNYVKIKKKKEPVN